MDAAQTASLSTLDSDIDRACSRLFDLFCERRKVVPLAYLMKSWPVCNVTLWGGKLSLTLQELVSIHREALEADEVGLIDVIRFLILLSERH